MSSSARRRPESNEYIPYFGKYIALVTDGDVLSQLEREICASLKTLRQIPERDACICHPPYTWTIKQVVGHLTDAERILGHRAFRFARGDQTPLPTIDEHEYVRQGNFDSRPLTDLAAEFELVRRAQLGLFRSLSDEAWSRSGQAHDNRISVRALIYVIAGHELHHMGIVRKRLG